MMEREKEEEVVTWLHGEIGKMEEGNGALRGVRLTAMREAGGVDYRQAEAQTVAFQSEFDSVADARSWASHVFVSTAAAFEEKFGPQAMVFTSLFETV